MKETLYVKYNRTRSKAYQTKVQIIKENDCTIVQKYALNPEAVVHLYDIINNYNNYNEIYRNVEMLKYIKAEDHIWCKYLKGQSISDILNSYIDQPEQLLEKINLYCDIMFDIKEEFYHDFTVTDSFVSFFGNIDGINSISGKAVSVCNMDAIFENYIMVDDKIYLIDYEWMMKIIVPNSFLKYRAVKMFFVKNNATLGKNQTMVQFLLSCNFKKEEIDVFEQMDTAFQEYVHGKNRRAIYTTNYKKPVISLSDLEINANMKNIISEKDVHIRNLESENETIHNRIKELEKVNYDLQETLSVLRREIRNPIYALYRLTRKVAYKILPYYVLRTLQILKNEGLPACIYRVKQRKTVNDSYARWISNFEKNDKLKPIDADRFHYQPIISIVIPVYNVSKKLLIECIESVVTQSYPNWQLCIADDCSTMPEVTKVLERYKNHPKIDIIYRKENGHISKATNSALALAKGEFVGFLDCDDTLASNALFEVVQALNNNSALDFIYTDEDKISEDGRNRHMPHFKPDWSPDTLMSLMYTCHFSVYRKSIVDKIGGLREGYEGSQDYDFVLRFTEQIPVSHIKHIPKVLYHWRERKESTATDGGAKEYIMDAAFKAKEDAIKRRGSQAKIELLEGLYQYRVNYIPMNNPKVGIVILSKDNPDIFMRCIESIVEKTRYSNYQMILVDNGSNNQNKDRYLSLCESNDCLYHYQKMDFNFSRMCNIGATKIECEYLLFLNDDVEVLDEEWLERMLGHAQQKHTGAVGAKLLYPNSTIIQHTGVLNIANGPSHSLVGYDDNELFYFARNKLDYNYLAVTAACIMISKQKFEEIDGFNEDLSVAYNDVDLCFKLVEHGYYNVVRNDVVLYHYESFSRGNDQIDKAKMQRLINEREKLYELHPNFSRVEKRDPFYSENLTQTNVNFAYNVSEIARKKNEYSVSKLANFTPSNQIKYNIESLETGDQISVQGWAYLEGEKWNNYRKVSILFIDNSDQVIKINTTKMYRSDIGVLIPNKRMFMIGFQCLCSNTMLKKNEKYKIAIAIGKRLTYIN